MFSDFRQQSDGVAHAAVMKMRDIGAETRERDGQGGGEVYLVRSTCTGKERQTVETRFDPLLVSSNLPTRLLAAPSRVLPAYVRRLYYSIVESYIVIVSFTRITPYPPLYVGVTRAVEEEGRFEPVVVQLRGRKEGCGREVQGSAPVAAVASAQETSSAGADDGGGGLREEV